MTSKSIGLVKYEDYQVKPANGFKLHYGGILPVLNIRYERYGKLNAKRSNAILIIHALTGDHHAAGRYTQADHSPGWWDAMVGPGKAFDTRRYQVICSNNLGGCAGTTGPNSINPQTARPYGLSFPAITAADMVAVQHLLMEHLELPFFHTIVGSSLGGMLALSWALQLPQRVQHVIAIATTAAQGAQAIAFSEVGRQAIMSDPAWQQGDYFNPRTRGAQGPRRGLALARMLAHITYLSPASMKQKFGRRRQKDSKPNFSFDPQFQVESYLQYQGKRFIDRFDANSYLYTTKALNYFELAAGFPSLSAAFKHTRTRYLFISFSSDWIYTKEMSFELLAAALKAGCDASYFEVLSNAGHDAFLLEQTKLTQLIQAFIAHKPLPAARQAAPMPQGKQTLTHPNHQPASPSLISPKASNEFKIIAAYTPKAARVLDLGCGDGTLLSFLQTQQQIIPYGVEKRHDRVLHALSRKLNIFQATLEEALPLFPNNSFDVVILSRTIQQLGNPIAVIDEMLRIGKTVIISFLNYGYISNRFKFLGSGRKPQSEAFPHSWHNSPDIHLLSIKDFESYIAERGYRIQQQIFLKGDWLSRAWLLPNLLAGVAIYILAGARSQAQRKR